MKMFSADSCQYKALQTNKQYNLEKKEKKSCHFFFILKKIYVYIDVFQKLQSHPKTAPSCTVTHTEPHRNLLKGVLCSQGFNLRQIEKYNTRLSPPPPLPPSTKKKITPLTHKTVVNLFGVDPGAPHRQSIPMSSTETGAGGSGFLYVVPRGPATYHSLSLGPASNNVAELRAVLAAIQMLTARPLSFSTLNFFTDSKYTINIADGIWQSKAHRKLVNELMAALAWPPSLGHCRRNVGQMALSPPSPHRKQSSNKYVQHVTTLPKERRPPPSNTLHSKYGHANPTASAPPSRPSSASAPPSNPNPTIHSHSEASPHHQGRRLLDVAALQEETQTERTND